MITLCFVYFRSLTLANLAAALYSVRQQDLTRVAELVILDNDTEDSAADIQFVIHALDFPIRVRLLSLKHGDRGRTHAWATNTVVNEAETSCVLVTRADYLLDPTLLERLEDRMEECRASFATANGSHLCVDVGEAEKTPWRSAGTAALRRLPGNEYDYTLIDTGVYLVSKAVFEAVGGLDETLSAWGHAQTEFQFRLHKAGVTMVRVPETLFYHPLHSAERDMERANAQLAASGVDLKVMWDRYEGRNPYR